MATPSPELAAIAKRYMRALFSGDGETVCNFLATSDPLIFCGSATDELWQGDFLREHFAGHVAEFPHTEILSQEVHAFEIGASGWAIWSGRIKPSTLDTEIEAHHSFAFVLEKGQWRVQLLHNSVAISNQETLGYEHSSISSLLAALEEQSDQFAPAGSVTLMFTDIVGSTALAVALGDVAWVQVVRRHLDQITACVTDQGGRVVKSLGDGTMSHFPSASAALRAAQDLQRALARSTQEPRLRIRAGVHTGDAIAADGDFFGTVVNTAARVAEAAGAGEISVSETSRLMVGAAPEFTFGPGRAVALKGLETRAVIHALDWQP